MNRPHLFFSRSLSVSLAVAMALPVVLSSSGCELIASVDRSKVDGAGGSTDTGGSTGVGGESQGTGGEASGAGGQESGAGGQESGAGGQESGAGGQGSGAGGHESGAGGEASAAGGMEDNGGSPSGLGGAGGEQGGPTGKVIYLTSTPKKANFGGVSGADAECNANPPNQGTYKALLVDGTTRVACTSADCGTSGVDEGVDWVLSPNTTYVREDGTTIIGTTSSAAIFPFPLDASIGTTGLSYWTGLEDDWTTSSDNCSGWTATSDVFANEGLADATDSQAITGLSESCATLAGAFFACVEQ
jgi:hypothetical protein